jgi:iron complex outermembrane receptor protein
MSKMLHHTRLAAAALAVLTTVTAPAAALERVEITGSAIRRTDSEGPTPLQVVTRKDIERSGATSLNELVRTLPGFDIFDAGEQGSNSPSGSGAAFVSLRGLDETNVLVLLNGRRLPINALQDGSGAGAAVDINMIPIAAVERIEVLKEGASAIYGADAVAGVVNIITRKNYHGAEISVGYGVSSRGDAREKTASLAAGHGNLDEDKFNVLFGLNVFKRDPLYRSDRADSSSADLRSQGGKDGRSSFSPYGNIYDYAADDYSGTSYRPCPPADFNQRCRFDFNRSVLTAYNGADRIGTLLHATLQPSTDLQAHASLTYSRARDLLQSQPVVDFFSVPIIDPAQKIYEDPNNPGTLTIAGRFMQGGPRTTERTSSLLNLSTGLDGSAGDIDWKIDFSHGLSKVTNRDSNFYDATRWLAATSSGQIDPTVLTNDPVLVESLKVSPVRTGRSTLSSLNGQLSGPLTTLPAGELRYATGVSIWHEGLTDTPDLLSQRDQVVGSIKQSAVDASRTAQALYGELAIPVSTDIELQAALRHDHYPSASATSPKLAGKFRLDPALALRASYARSFRAPTLKQMYGGAEQGSVTITDATLCRQLGATPPCSIDAFATSGSNPDLKPEHGSTASIGAVFDVTRQVNISLDYWQIRKTDGISTQTVAEAISSGHFSRDGARLIVDTNLQNIARQETAGLDVDGRLRLPAGDLGHLTLRNMLTWYQYVRRTATDGSGLLADYNGTYRYPHWRNTFTVVLENGDWSWQAALRSVAGFWDQDTPTPIQSGTRRVAPHEEVDLQMQYGGRSGWTFTGGIKNLLDRMPPFSQTNASDNQYTQLGFAELYTNRGRFFYLSGRYSF